MASRVVSCQHFWHWSLFRGLLVNCFELHGPTILTPYISWNIYSPLSDSWSLFVLLHHSFVLWSQIASITMRKDFLNIFYSSTGESLGVLVPHHHNIELKGKYGVKKSAIAAKIRETSWTRWHKRQFMTKVFRFSREIHLKLWIPLET